MDHDDPKKPEFKTWDSFAQFARRVQNERRFVWDEATEAFLNTVLATIRARDVTLPEGMILSRAQRGVDWIDRKDDDGNDMGEEPSGFGRERMKPLQYRASEGRANSRGIPVLYLATTEQTAISEVRPWIGDSISVAQFKLRRKIKAIDLSKGHGQISWSKLSFDHLMGKKTPGAALKEKTVWIEIDNAFSRPVTQSDDLAHYVPTQILAELFRNAGYEAVIYKSQFGEKGFNIALFDIDSADPINCAPFEVTDIDVKSREIGNRWFSRNK